MIFPAQAVVDGQGLGNLKVVLRKKGLGIRRASVLGLITVAMVVRSG